MAALPQGRVSAIAANAVLVLNVPYHGPEGTRVLLRATGVGGAALGSDSAVDFPNGWALTGDREFLFTFPEGDSLEIWARGGNPSGPVTVQYMVLHAV